ncbi:MAG: hypothetical protein AB1797_04080 [bacterium]
MSAKDPNQFSPPISGCANYTCSDHQSSPVDRCSILEAGCSMLDSRY